MYVWWTKPLTVQESMSDEQRVDVQSFPVVCHIFRLSSSCLSNWIVAWVKWLIAVEQELYNLAWCEPQTVYSSGSAPRLSSVIRFVGYSSTITQYSSRLCTVEHARICRSHSQTILSIAYKIQLTTQFPTLVMMRSSVFNAVWNLCSTPWLYDW